MRRLRKRLDTSEKKVTRLKDKIDRLVQERGVTVDNELHDDLGSIMQEETDNIRKNCPEKTFQRTLWEQQLNAMTKTDAWQVRWHPLMIKWCLNIKLISSTAYHAIRSSGFLTLPSERTLRDYTNYIKVRPGFQEEVTWQLVEEVDVGTLDHPRKHVGSGWDEN